MSAPENGLIGVTTFRVPRPVVEDALDHLYSTGAAGAEGVALWAGQRDGPTFHVRSTIVPAQRSYRTPEGLYYVVAGSELQRINRHLLRFGLTLGAQVHSHAGAAHHSVADDTYPIVAVLGGLSIVVPDFALAPLDMESWAVYQLRRGTGWTAISHDDVAGLISIANPVQTSKAPHAAIESASHGRDSRILAQGGRRHRRATTRRTGRAGVRWSGS